MYSLSNKISVLAFVACIGSMTPSVAHSNPLGERILISAISAPQHGLRIPVVSESEEQAAQKFIEKLGDDAISFLSNKKLSSSQKEKEFRRIMNSSFDMKTIGRFALGKNWRTATPAQQKEYQKLFNNMVVAVYSQRLDNYQGQQFSVGKVREAGKKDLLVSSHILPENGAKVKVDWRVRKKDGRYKIIDVLIEGVSMSLTQRSDFSSVIQRGGGNIEVLLEHLRK